MVRNQKPTHSPQESKTHSRSEGREPVDTGTTELHKRQVTRVERRRSGTVCIRVLDGNQVDRLLWSDKITPEEHSVLTGFQLDAHRAGLMPIRAANLQKVSGGGHEMSDIEAILRLKHAKACSLLSVRVGIGGLHRVLSICIDDRPALDADLPLLRQACEVLTLFRSDWIKPMS